MLGRYLCWQLWVLGNRCFIGEGLDVRLVKVRCEDTYLFAHLCIQTMLFLMSDIHCLGTKVFQR